jgi:hypothetical protein
VGVSYSHVKHQRRHEFACFSNLKEEPSGQLVWQLHHPPLPVVPTITCTSKLVIMFPDNIPVTLTPAKRKEPARHYQASASSASTLSGGFCVCSNIRAR